MNMPLCPNSTYTILVESSSRGGLLDANAMKPPYLDHGVLKVMCSSQSLFFTPVGECSTIQGTCYRHFRREIQVSSTEGAGAVASLRNTTDAVLDHQGADIGFYHVCIMTSLAELLERGVW